MKLLKLSMLAQSAYYLVTGLWPLIDIDSFMAVTGPKTDTWLVKMVSLLIVVIGLTLIVGKNQPGTQTFILSIASALSFAGIDIYYSLNGTISDIYLADAVIEFILIGFVIAGIYSSKAELNKKRLSRPLSNPKPL